MRLMRFLPIATLACDPAAGSRPDVAVRVENGVTIVENAGLHVADSLAWTIDTSAVVRIGVVDGPPEYMIGRLAGMLRRPDGSILVADATAHELRVFDERGRFVRKVGRRGEGPGEYGWLTHLLPYVGDSVVVMDNEASRATILDPDLGYVRRFRPRLLETRARWPMTSHRLIGFFADGQPVLSDYLNVCGPRRMNGFCEDSVVFFRTDSSGATTGRFGRFVYTRGESRRVPNRPNIGWSEPHPQAMWAVHGDRFYYADARRFEIRVHRNDGSLERIVRVAGAAPGYDRDEIWPPQTSPPTDDSRESQTQRAFAEAFATAELPDTFPAFSDLLVDAPGNIWVREYVPGRYMTEIRPRWFVFDSTGALRWAIRSPPAMIRYFRPYVHIVPSIGEDHVLASVRDPDGVESVVVYRLIKRSP